MTALRLSPFSTLFFAGFFAGAFVLSGCADDDGGANDGSSGDTTTAGITGTSSTGADTTTSTGSESSTTGTTEVAGESESSGGEPLLSLGFPCLESDECESGHCYHVAGMGVCSECNVDADCDSGGCSPPNIFVDPFAPGFCNDGGLGQPCNEDDACSDDRSCIEVVDIPDQEIRIATCSECASDDDCEDGQTCAPHYDIANFAGYLSCIDPGTVALGGGCDPEAAESHCESGVCSEVSVLFGALNVGVCGTCAVNADCEVEGEECLPATITPSQEIVPPQCGVPEPQD